MSIKKRLTALSFAIIFSAGSVVSSPLSAASINDFLSSNEAPWYDNSFQSSIGACNGVTIVGSTNVHKMWNYMVQKGLSTEAVAGVLGNIQMESGFSATRQEDSQRFPNGGWGIVQWTAERRTAIVSKLPANIKKYHAAEYGKATSKENGYVAEGIPENDADELLAFEMDYLYDEAIVRQTRNHPVLSGYGMTGMSEWEALTKATSIRQASDLWLYSFERPADQSTGHAADRAKLGQDIFDELIGDNAGLAGGGQCMSGEVSDLQALTQEYAWEEFRPNYTNLREPYAKAVSAAQASGRYVGGSGMPGVDCGGFVTLLLTNSGFEPRYNYEGKGGNTVWQEKWVKENGWIEVKPAGSKFDVADLQPGDVAFWPGHTYVFVGEGVFPDGTQIASASLRERAPMAGGEDLNYKGTKWYRKPSATTETQ